MDMSRYKTNRATGSYINTRPVREKIAYLLSFVKRGFERSISQKTTHPNNDKVQKLINIKFTDERFSLLFLLHINNIKWHFLTTWTYTLCQDGIRNTGFSVIRFLRQNNSGLVKTYVKFKSCWFFISLEVSQFSLAPQLK